MSAAAGATASFAAAFIANSPKIVPSSAGVTKRKGGAEGRTSSRREFTLERGRQGDNDGGDADIVEDLELCGG